MKHTQGKWEVIGKNKFINQISIGIRNNSGEGADLARRCRDVIIKAGGQENDN